MIGEIALQDDVPRERLSIEDIEQRFPRQWVLIDDPEADQTEAVLSGRVIWHSADKHEVYEKLRKLDSNDVAVFFTGPLPKAYYLL
jgi:hypothetical protein